MRKKRYQNLGVLLGLIVILFIVDILSTGNLNDFTHSNVAAHGDAVLELSVSGVISAETQEELLSTLQNIDSASGIRGIILKINSPGGTTGTSQEIYDELMRIRKSGIKVVAVIEDLGASGGYYIASASDWIIANGSSLTGSIGVIMSTLNFKGIADKYGIRSFTFVSGKMKDMLSPFRDIRPDEKAYIQQMIVTIYNQFVKDVLAGRNASTPKITREKLLSLADGRVFTGIDAKKEALIDELGGYSVAVKEMKKLLGTESILIHKSSRGYLHQIFQALRGEFHGKMDSSTSWGIVKEEFLKQHTGTPLYFSTLGGGSL